MGQRGFRVFLILVLLSTSLSSFSQNLRRSGQKIVDQSGNEVILRGMGLGGWMLQEPYMMEMSGIAVAQWDIRAKIEALIGATNTNLFYDAWLNNHCTKKDIDSMAAWGFNSVRLPMHYNLYTLPIEQEPVPGNQTWLAKGFALTDSLIKWCSANQMYVILDLHAAPGGQGKDYAICDGNPAKPSLWESEANKQKMIALWKKLAERYVNEPWVGGYDIINEPNWSFTAGGNQNGCSENSNAPLRQLMINITNAIRQVDTKHIIIIEGNCWGNNYNGIFPVWDENMVVSFHKYWSNNDVNSIQSILNIRSQQNIPIWLGESGENSNPWFTDAIRLVETNKIGWAWWPLKKIGSVAGPLTIVKTPEYQQLLDYWKFGGATPSPVFATYTLMQMASNAKPEYCIYHKDVTDAMFRQVYDSLSIPFKNHLIPGVIQSTDYDLGRHGKAYFDTDIADYHVSSGTYTAWNSGYSYRNDGVDIEVSKDPHLTSNGFDVGWTADKEWLQYTAVVDSSWGYDLMIRYAGPAGSKIQLSSEENAVTKIYEIPSSGGYQTWTSIDMSDLILQEGVQKLRLKFVKGGVNIGFLRFTRGRKIADIPLRALSAETIQQSEMIVLGFNKMLAAPTVSMQGFTCKVNGNVANIKSLVPDSMNSKQVFLTIDQGLSSTDKILLSHAGEQLLATDGTILETFSDLPVVNNLPVYMPVPGKIEAEDFFYNQGLSLETTTDVGGGQNIGYTDPGDYLDYRINVQKSGLYNLELRVAAFNTTGSLQVVQMNEKNEILNTATVSIPVTGGWQTWKSIYAEVSLTMGATKLRIKIVKSGFNLNWFKFYDKSQGINEHGFQHIRIFPNPAHQELTIENEQALPLPGSIRLMNLRGVQIRSVAMNRNESICRIFVGDLPKGLYFVELEGSGTIFRQKLIIQ